MTSMTLRTSTPTRVVILLTALLGLGAAHLGEGLSNAPGQSGAGRRLGLLRRLMLCYR